tara:strand:+ start:1526 stop:2392 length:867 start_codon:yes stop_codon:yes gene_type:complete
MKLALGSAQIGMQYGLLDHSKEKSVSEVREILKIASENSINTIDTAISYGRSEEILGKANVQGFDVITKIPKFPSNIDKPKKWVENHIYNSLKHLKIKGLYAVLFHESDDLDSCFADEIFTAIEKLKEKKLIKKIGVSIYNPDQLDKIINRYEINIVQAPLNILDRRMITSGWMQKLHTNSIEIHTRSCFLQGLLLMNPKTIPKKFNEWKGLFFKLQDWCNANGKTMLEVCLDFQNSISEINKTIIGIDSKQHLLEIITKNNSFKNSEIPNISSEDENLINPSKWRML